MGNVTPFKRKVNGGKSCADGHIDSANYAELLESLTGYLELFIPEGGAGRHCDEQEHLIGQLDQLARRFTSQKGAA